MLTNLHFENQKTNQFHYPSNFILFLLLLHPIFKIHDKTYFSNIFLILLAMVGALIY